MGPVCTPAVCTPQPLLLLRDVGSGWGSRCAQVLGARRGAGAVAVDPCPAVGWPGWKAASAPFFPCWPGLPHLGGERDHGFHPGTSSGADRTVPSPCFTSPDAPGSVGEGRALPAQLGPWDCPSRTKDSGPACAGDVRLGLLGLHHAALCSHQVPWASSLRDPSGPLRGLSHAVQLSCALRGTHRRCPAPPQAQPPGALLPAPCSLSLPASGGSQHLPPSASSLPQAPPLCHKRVPLCPFVPRVRT